MLKFIEVDLEKIRSNVEKIKQRLRPGVDFLAIVKSNAYGHGAEKIAEEIESQVDFFAVDNVKEAQALSSRVDRPILVLGAWERKDLTKIDVNQVRVPVYSKDSLDKLLNYSGPRINVHLKVDTGMHRLGFSPEKTLKASQKIKDSPHLKLEGVWSHFAQSGDTEGEEYSKKQLKLFNDLRKQLAEEGVTPNIFHMANSSAILNYPQSQFDMVRSGMMIYGYWSSRETKKEFKGEFNLQPALTLKTKVAQVRELAKGEEIGYGLTYKMKRKGKVAVLPVGYKDGYARHLSNRGEVLIDGQRCPIVGRICMRMTMVNVSKLPEVSPGDEVVLLGGGKTDKIRADELADQIKTIPYEILSRLDSNIERIYLNEQK